MARAHEDGSSRGLDLGRDGLRHRQRLLAVRLPSLGRARGGGPDRGHRPAALHRHLQHHRRRPGEPPGASRDASSLWTDRETPASGVGGPAVEGARRLPAAARRALRRGLLRARHQHPRRRPGGRRPDPRASTFRRTCRSTVDVEAGPALPLRRDRDRQRAARHRRHATTTSTPRSRSASRPASRRLLRGHQPGLGHRRSSAGGSSSHAKAREADREVVADHANDRARRRP